MQVADCLCMCITSLHFGALPGSCSIVKQLVTAGTRVDARNARGATALMLIDARSWRRVLCGGRGAATQRRRPNLERQGRELAGHHCTAKGDLGGTAHVVERSAGSR
jgi:uncharacterized ferredoxin-like protein